MVGAPLREIGSALGVELPNLLAAAQTSAEMVDQARAELLQAVPVESDDADVIVLGSIARAEASTRSDFDYLVVMHKLPGDVRLGRRLINAAETARSKIEIREPGRTGMFSRVVSAADLTERIGLEEDTNVSHSLRILTLEESVSIYKPDLHDALLHAILERYLVDLGPNARVPRFLLNDVVRYWRTLAVDYQAKRWKEVGRDKWGLRYLKLIIPRKLVFAGTLASLFLVDPPTTDLLLEEFKKPALVRLGQLQDKLSGEHQAALARILEIADHFVELTAEEEFRAEAEAVESRAAIPSGSRFENMNDQARELQENLERIFFESEVLASKTRRYLSF